MTLPPLVSQRWVVVSWVQKPCSGVGPEAGKQLRKTSMRSDEVGQIFFHVNNVHFLYAEIVISLSSFNNGWWVLKLLF